MAGVTIGRYWKKVPITSYATQGTKIQIRLQDIPPLHAELYRISTLPDTAGATSYCGNTNTDGDGVGYAKPSGTPYNCTQPNAYIQLSGTSGIPFAHDEVGEDSADHYDFWGADNGFGYGMRSANRLYNNATCVARSATPLVLLPTIAEAQLNAGMESTGNFNVRVECSNSVQSGISDTQTALGIQCLKVHIQRRKNWGLSIATAASAPWSLIIMTQQRWQRALGSTSQTVLTPIRR